MFKKNRKLITLGFGATIAGAILFNSALMADSNKVEVPESKLQAFIKFTKVLNIIQSEYVDEVNTSTLIDKALKGLMQNLDPHSAFMDASEFKDLNIQTNGEFGGLGIVVGMKDGVLTVISPIDDTPAKKAGIKAGDIILKIDDKATLGMSINDAVKLMRGKPKTPITLTIIRKGEHKPLKIKIIRAIIKIKSVKPKIIKLDNNKGEILDLRISSFDSHVVKGIKKSIKEHPNAKGYLIDLRNNPGGLLDQAVGVLDMFIDKGPLVIQRGRHKEEDQEYVAHKKGTDTKTPIVVLVNDGSASASEIVSGALQDDRRAIIVGEKTFGKGSVQVVIPIGKKQGLKLTVARYYLPSGRTIQNKGVTPDIIVYPGKVPMENNNSISIKERDLKAHLKAELLKLDKKKIKKSTPKENKHEKIITKEQIYNDAQLKSGIDILKSLIIIQNAKGNK